MINKVTIRVSGRKIERFIKRLLDNKIYIENLRKIGKDEILVDINLNEYKKVKKIKSIYKIRIIKHKGLKSLSHFITVNKMTIFVILCSFILLFNLSNTIFEVQVIHDNQALKSLILEELTEYGVKVHKKKIDDKKIQKIKEEILNKHKNKIEWIEIEERGTSYIIRVEERKVVEKEEKLVPRSIIASKSAVIKKIVAQNGVVEKEIGQYVKKGDVIINGNIKLGDNVKSSVPAKGTVFGEVWYTVKLKYPYIIKEKRYTGNVNNALMINIFGAKKILYGTKYTNYETSYKIRLSTTFLPIFLAYGKNMEYLMIDTILTEEEAYEMAIVRGKKEIESNLKEGEYIIDFKVLNVSFNENNIELEIFYNICENITDYLLLN